jgi:squalene monooxygenase
MLAERDWSEPDRIVGELLQPGGVLALQKLGIEGAFYHYFSAKSDAADCLEGIDGVAVQGYTIFPKVQDQVDKDMKEALLPYPDGQRGKSFHHGKFINRLREKAKAAKDVTCVAGTVTSLIRDEQTARVLGVNYKPPVTDDDPTPGVKQLFAPLTVVADGCFSRFRNEIATRQVNVKSHFVGFVLQDCPLPYPNHGHVILANPSPILLYQVLINRL